MQIKINAIETAPQRVTITKRLYTQLTQKAALYDDYKAAQRTRAKRINDILTPEQRSDRARKAARIRWEQRKESNNA